MTLNAAQRLKMDCAQAGALQGPVDVIVTRESNAQRAVMAFFGQGRFSATLDKVCKSWAQIGNCFPERAFKSPSWRMNRVCKASR